MKRKKRMRSLYKTVAKFALSILLCSQIISYAPAQEKSAAEKYKEGVECVGMYDYFIAMMPASHPGRAQAEGLRSLWFDYTKVTMQSKQAMLDNDIAQQKSRIQTIATTKSREEVVSLMTPLQKQCAVVPAQVPASVSAKDSNPFELENPTAEDTYIAAVKCVGQYAATEGNQSENYKIFSELARKTMPGTTDEQFRKDIIATTSNFMKILIESNHNAHAAITSSCKTGLSNLQ